MNWKRLAETWGRRPVRIAGAGAPVDAGRCLQAVRTACGPFRAGTRFRAVPDVRFSSTAGRLRAPSDLLLGPEDQTAAGYLDRLDRQPGTLLTVEHPLVVDFDLWSAVRDQLGELWRLVGWPSLAVTAELAIGRRYVRTENAALPPTSAGLVWVLEGQVSVRLWRATEAPDSSIDVPQNLLETAPDATLRGEAGDLLYWPADRRAVETFDAGGMTLRLAIRGDHRGAMGVVKNLLIELAESDERYANGQVPYFPCQPSRSPDGAVDDLEELERTGALVHRLIHSADTADRLRNLWALRRSTAGLEPAPTPLTDSDLDHDDRIHVTSELIQVQLPEGRGIWAANGHTFPIAGGASERIRAELLPGREIDITELCRLVGAGPRHPGVLTLLRTLHRLRAIRRVNPRTSEQTPRKQERRELAR